MTVDKMVADLAALVEAESPSEDPAAVARCAELVARLGERLTGRAPEWVGRHLLWRFSDRTDVLLLGHCDTVWPLGTLARWHAGRSTWSTGSRRDQAAST